MSGRWIKEMPKKPGRYWYRTPGGDDKGIALIRWLNPTLYEPARKPELEVRSTAIFTGTYWDDSGSGNGSREGWSFGSDTPDDAEFWSVQIEPPSSMDLKPINPDPEYLSPKEIKDYSKRQAASSKEHKKRAKAEKAAQKELLATFRAAGKPFFCCPSCEALYAKDELGTQRGCTHCSIEFFVAPGDERNCTDCNRPFTSLVEEGVTECCEEIAEEKL